MLSFMTEQATPYVLEVKPPTPAGSKKIEPILFNSADHDHPMGYEVQEHSGLVRVFTVVPSPPFGPQIQTVSFGPDATPAIFAKGTEVIAREDKPL